MGDKGPIYVDASRPAALLHAGISTECLTLQEAVIAWHQLPEARKKATTIAVTGTGVVYKAAEIERLHYGEKPRA